MKAAWQEMWTKLQDWVNILISNVPNVLLAVVTFLLFYWIASVVQKLLRRNLSRLISQDSIRMLIARGAFLATIAIGFILALGILNLDTVLKSVLAGAGVAGLAIGLALQGTLTNTFSGVFLAVKDVMTIGDWVETNGFSGHVEKITLRHTFVREPDNNLVALPNRMVLENPFKNYGLTPEIRVIIKCGIGYSEDLDHVERVAKEAITNHFDLDQVDDVEFFYEDFGASAINFILRFRIRAIDKLTLLEARSRSITTLKKAFDRERITIPYPIRTVEFGVQELKISRDAGSSEKR